MLEDTIMKSVIATTQTYVEALKGKNAFDEAAQKEADIEEVIRKAGLVA